VLVAAVHSTPVLRDLIKLHHVPPPPLTEEEGGEEAVFTSLLAVLTSRHHRSLAPVWARLAGGSPALQELLRQQGGAGAGDARFKAYVGLLLALVNASAQAFLQRALGSESEQGRLDVRELEARLCRLEDAALVAADQDCSGWVRPAGLGRRLGPLALLALGGGEAGWAAAMGTPRPTNVSRSIPTLALRPPPCARRYLLQEGPALALARIRRVPPEQRIPTVCASLHAYRTMQDAVRGNAAHVVQAVWRQYLARKRGGGAGAAGAGGAGDG
jgi:hypothetical protein